jgi:hypothetical protein
MKKPGTILIAVGILLVLIAGFILYLLFGVSQSILPIETKIVDWQGIPITISASGFDTNINDRSLPFCDSNDGDVTASNTYNVNNLLSLGSSLSTAKRACGPNRIYTEMEIPAGKLTVTCNLKAFESYNDNTVSTCKIVSGLTKLYKKDASYNYECELSNRRPDWILSYCRSPVSDSQVLTFDEPTKIKVEVTTKTGGTGSASASINLGFEAMEIEEPIEEPNQTEEDCPALNELDCESQGMIEIIETDNKGCQINSCETQGDECPVYDPLTCGEGQHLESITKDGCISSICVDDEIIEDKEELSLFLWIIIIGLAIIFILLIVLLIIYLRKK